MTTITILTGPQGAGNHLFSKIFDLHPAVSGWKGINEGKYLGHDQEPYYEIWNDPSAIDLIDWSKEHHVISISCPYVSEGLNYFPNYCNVVEKLQSKGFKVQIAIIGRDQNILAKQQYRVRGKKTTDDFTQFVSYLTALPHTFLSQELLYLYKHNYIRSIGKQLGIPVCDDDRFSAILENDANNKYITTVTEVQELDKEVWRASKFNDH
jgi:hypothetical protein